MNNDMKILYGAFISSMSTTFLIMMSLLIMAPNNINNYSFLCSLKYGLPISTAGLLAGLLMMKNETKENEDDRDKGQSL